MKINVSFQEKSVAPSSSPMGGQYMRDKFPLVGELPGPESEAAANMRRGVK